MTMRYTVAVSAVAVALMTLGSLVTRAADGPDGSRWWSHVAVLADDKLEGRNTGSEGHRKAAEYVAGELARSGLKPAGTDGYFQPVGLISREIDEDHSSLTLERNGKNEPLALGGDAIISSRWGDPCAGARGPARICGLWAPDPRCPS